MSMYYNRVFFIRSEQYAADYGGEVTESITPPSIETGLPVHSAQCAVFIEQCVVEVCTPHLLPIQHPSSAHLYLHSQTFVVSALPRQRSPSAGERLCLTLSTF